MVPTSPPNSMKCRGEGLSRSPCKSASHQIQKFTGLAAWVWLVSFASSLQIQAYTFITTPPTVWPAGTIPMVLMLGPATSTLIDGNTSWDVVAENALVAWNPYLGTVQFTYRVSSGAAYDGDGINQALFAYTVYGKAFGQGVLAVTTRWSIGTKRTEGDTLFNSAQPWNSYRGPLLPAASGGTLNDLQRVATHEFGHTLGLDHPDQAGQSVIALMNSTISDLDHLVTDDIAGVQALYSIAQGIPPSIVTPPQSQTVPAGSTVTLSVSASGSQPFSYQWRRNGVSISGATTASYTISNVQTSQAGNYTVVVSNSSGTATSATAVLTVNVPPSITAQPQSRTITAGNSAAFSVTASGTAPLSYQWYWNNSAVAGATATSYTISTTQPSKAGDYKVTVSNVAGSVDSAVATLTVQFAPLITGQPQSQTVIVGDLVTFTVAAGGVPAPSYQWRFNGSPIPTASQASYTIAGVGTNDAGNYSVTISNAVGHTNSATATLTVLVPFPGIYNTGLSDSRTLLGDDQVDPHYKLVLNPNNPASSDSVVQDSTQFPIAGGPWVPNSSISKWIGPAFNTGGAAAGNYIYQLTVDLTGYDPRTAFLAGSWAADDGGSIFLNGADTGFSSAGFSAFSTFTLTNGFVLGANLIEFRISNAWSSPTGLRVENLRGTAQKATVPFVGTLPEGATKVIGDNVTFAVVAGGASPLRYQWRFNGADIPTATGASLALTNLQLSQAGNYDVIVWNNSGSVTSAVATLTVGIWADVYYDFETAATSPVWLGTTQMIQNTSASHQGTNAIALTGAYPNGYVLTELPQGTTNIEFYFYDECGPNPGGSQYMFFRLLEVTNSTAFAGFSMLDGGWGTTPPITMNHYYAYANEEYSARTIGPLRTIGWHKFTFGIGPESVAMSVDGTLIFETNMIRTARYLELQCGNSGGWGRMDDLVLAFVTVPPPPLTASRAGNGIRVAWPVSATGFVLQETSSPPGSWTNSSAAVVVQGNENVAVIATTGTAKFYRLRK
jgi:hypothetical protein